MDFVLKYFEETEAGNAEIAELAGKEHSYVLEEKYRWCNWASPKTNDGEIDHNRKLQGDDLIEFVNQELFPYLKSLRDTAENSLQIEHKIGEIFGDLANRVRDEVTLEKSSILSTNKFRSADEQHEMSELYEAHPTNGECRRNGGEYYTPRPLIRAMIEVLDPKPGETIYDPACGSGGFLVESYKYILENSKTYPRRIWSSFKPKLFGKRKKGLPFIIANMHMIFNGIKSPHIVRIILYQEM